MDSRASYSKQQLLATPSKPVRAKNKYITPRQLIKYSLIQLKVSMSIIAQVIFRLLATWNALMENSWQLTIYKEEQLTWQQHNAIHRALNLAYGDRRNIVNSC